MKVTCYGHDQRPGNTIYGDCKHPCNARPGCEYQAYEEDASRLEELYMSKENTKKAYL